MSWLRTYQVRIFIFCSCIFFSLIIRGYHLLRSNARSNIEQVALTNPVIPSLSSSASDTAIKTYYNTTRSMNTEMGIDSMLNVQSHSINSIIDWQQLISDQSGTSDSLSIFKEELLKQLYQIDSENNQLYSFDSLAFDTTGQTTASFDVYHPEENEFIEDAIPEFFTESAGDLNIDNTILKDYSEDSIHHTEISAHLENSDTDSLLTNKDVSSEQTDSEQIEIEESNSMILAHLDEQYVVNGELIYITVKEAIPEYQITEGMILTGICKLRDNTLYINVSQANVQGRLKLVNFQAYNIIEREGIKTNKLLYTFVDKDDSNWKDQLTTDEGIPVKSSAYGKTGQEGKPSATNNSDEKKRNKTSNMDKILYTRIPSQNFYLKINK